MGRSHLFILYTAFYFIHSHLRGNEMYGFLEVHRKYKACKIKKLVHIFIFIVAISKFPPRFMSGKALVQQFSPHNKITNFLTKMFGI